MQDFSQARNQVLQQIQHACDLAHRTDVAKLLAVSKTHDADTVRAMYDVGQRSFGENYLQEACHKIDELKDLEIQWHFIGHVQRNKTKLIAAHFSWVHGVDRLIIAQRLSEQRGHELPPLNICIQVNIDAQDSKDGCAPEDVIAMVEKIQQLPHIQLRGLMVIPAPNHTQAFFDAQALFKKVALAYPTLQSWDTLSMGMSGDLLPAIQAGSTLVRIGTALFGARDYSQDR
ncbi:YggS family pyridoxal phosphate-dependent enzyme [Acinetobacter sp. B5B]|uniref:YggS family pyridoxal phosphate-dependent enzyme n=1 Tax=Acinetobacter baretiae TaxID=2605383 RepID=UPI0018C277B2|nr:YggS family pyridoxal phosphate-dependent enzyme [Acinetobacter baretiae]MBF7683507.1 YggS family pyridoxal phosphate-dependent enzyme [Acinetobacter baretiae]MBF7684813.1 YggS family pyridoxal phosphate-dependent enzyme [Acinetobacter baretiae]